MVIISPRMYLIKYIQLTPATCTECADFGHLRYKHLSLSKSSNGDMAFKTAHKKKLNKLQCLCVVVFCSCCQVLVYCQVLSPL